MNTLELNHIGVLTPEKITRVTEAVMAMPQADCPVKHIFGPGVYIRQITIPAHAVIVGRYHRHEHVSVMLKGSMTLLNPDGSKTEVAAPATINCQAGQKIAFTHEEVIFSNIYATECRDSDKLEEQLFDVSAELNDAVTNRLLRDAVIHQADRDDFLSAVADLGMTAEEMNERSVCEKDQCHLPFGDYGFAFAESSINGRGLFASSAFNRGDDIGPCVIMVGGNPKRTPVARYINHAKNPNAVVVELSDGCVNLVATRDISGSKGGQLGDEITVDYRKFFKGIS
jgi:hypothetical protein